MRSLFSSIATLLALAVSSQALAQPAMKDSADTAPPGYTGPKFVLSKAYPTTKPTPGTLPWKAFDFKTQPRQYMDAVLNYAFEGNLEVDWQVHNNAVRKWFHAPGLVKGASGREFIRGLTRERGSREGELHALQTNRHSNWGVGMYNDIGGFTIGQVWADTANPDPTKAKFADGTVAIKLLFTTAPVAEVPYLADAPSVKANIGGTIATRTQQDLLLLQIDIAVRDTRNTLTGWVFGTYVYHNTAPGTDPWRKLVPVGLMWGNDPTYGPNQKAAGQPLKQSWISGESLAPNIGWLGRLNGPVDNPDSSCLSCHMFAGRAQSGATLTTTNVFDASDTLAQKKQYFRNIKAGKHPQPNVTSLDYSLQLHMGIDNYPGAIAQGLQPPGILELAALPGASPSDLISLLLGGMLQADTAPATQAEKHQVTDPDVSLREGRPATSPVEFLPVTEETDGEVVDLTRDEPAADDKARSSRLPIWIILFATLLVFAIILRRKAVSSGAPPSSTS